jgi:hypothetical protein
MEENNNFKKPNLLFEKIFNQFIKLIIKIQRKNTINYKNLNFNT